MNKGQIKVIDFFCGAGGFSEGFRQQNCKIVGGIDHWEPAVKTHNLNHDLDDEAKDILCFWGNNSGDTAEIDQLPADIDVIIGSPPCVNFSMSNKSGKADKAEGIRMIKIFLRVIAVRKHSKGSTLKAWLMENVPNSQKYIQASYSFANLHLEKWAERNRLAPNDTALSFDGDVLNAKDYGAPQSRDRYVCGEIVGTQTFPLPPKNKHTSPTLRQVKSLMPIPISKKQTGFHTDPNYRTLKVDAAKLTDQFYDSGMYITDWEKAKYLKTRHPYMGKMSFPENEEKTSRTITATKSMATREAIIYKSEYKRKGHGQYRSPTIREIATLTGYPYTYQFFGSESTKWKLVGNSVSPKLGSALAKKILQELGCTTVPESKVTFSNQKENYKMVPNLNSTKRKDFSHPRCRKSPAKFRRTIYKGRNSSVDLLNYDFSRKTQVVGDKWYVCVFYGTGEGYHYDSFEPSQLSLLKHRLKEKFKSYNEIDRLIGESPISGDRLQEAYETDYSMDNQNNPLILVERVHSLVKDYASSPQEINLTEAKLTRSRYSIAHALSIHATSRLLGHV